MSAIKLDLTTSFQDTSAFGPQRQVCVSGVSADFIADLYIGNDTNNNVVKVGRIIGPQASLALNNPAPTLKYVLVRGSVGSGAIWLQGQSGVTSIATLSTSFVSTVAVGPNRQLYLTASKSTLAIDVYGSESTTGQRVRIASLIGNPNGSYVSIPNDSSLAMEYVVVKGAIGTAVVFVLGGVAASSGTGAFTNLNVSGDTTVATLEASGALTALSGGFGATPRSATGDVRLNASALVTARDAANDADFHVASIDGSNTLTIGGLNGDSNVDHLFGVSIVGRGVNIGTSGTNSGIAVGTIVRMNGTGQMAFNGGTPVTKPTVTGSKGANAALASLLTALGATGLNLLTDSST